MLLLALNVFALAMIPVTFGSVVTAEIGVVNSSPARYAEPADGLMFNGNPVGNIYPYDARGNPLTQPWTNGRTRLYSVFPLPEQTSDPETGKALGEARLQTPPFATLPPVRLKGVIPSVLAPSAQVKQKRAGSGG